MMKIIINKSFKILITYVSTIAIGLNEYYRNVTLYVHIITRYYNTIILYYSIAISASMCNIVYITYTL